ncbi:MAG: TIGR04013 family B12-binding domain/radical SAM domain-containing protein [Candidatus Thorarchaeota archaeon]
MGPHQLIFRAHSSSRYSVAALLGAVEMDSRLTELQVSAPLEISAGMIQKAIEKGPVMVAQSVMSTQTERVFDESRSVKKQFGDSVTLIGGGPHASARPADLLEAGFDCVVVGEGEKVFPDVLWHLMNDKDPQGIEGVVSKRVDSYPIPMRLPKVVLDDHPPFALDMNVLGPIEVTRGCSFACKYCCTPFLTGGGVRHRSADSVVRWLNQAVQRRGFRRTWLLSPNALSYGGRGREVSLDRLEQLLKETTSVDGLEEVFFGAFPSEVRPEFITKGALDTMRSYVSNETLQIGLQSASDRVLDLCNRHHSVSEGLDAIRTALDSGFIPHVDMIFGLPGETAEELSASIYMCERLAEMGARVHGHVFMPLPGSAFENMPPGRLDADSRSTLGEFSRRGILTGSWSAQESFATKLASNRDVAKSS